MPERAADSDITRKLESTHRPRLRMRDEQYAHESAACYSEGRVLLLGAAATVCRCYS